MYVSNTYLFDSLSICLYIIQLSSSFLRSSNSEKAAPLFSKFQNISAQSYRDADRLFNTVMIEKYTIIS